MHGKEVRDECLATVKHDLLYNVAMENREFADLSLGTFSLGDYGAREKHGCANGRRDLRWCCLVDIDEP